MPDLSLPDPFAAPPTEPPRCWQRAAAASCP